MRMIINCNNAAPTIDSGNRQYFGGLGRTRTYDLLFRKQTFYPLNYETFFAMKIILI